MVNYRVTNVIADRTLDQLLSCHVIVHKSQIAHGTYRGDKGTDMTIGLLKENGIKLRINEMKTVAQQGGYAVPVSGGFPGALVTQARS